MRWTISVLGPLEVRSEAGIAPLRAQQPQTLLCALIQARGRVVSVDSLIDMLWEERQQASARHAVRVHVSALRRALPGLILTRDPGYALAVEDVELDADRFEALVARARTELGAGDAEAAGRTLDEALSLPRGEPYANVTERFCEP